MFLFATLTSLNWWARHKHDKNHLSRDQTRLAGKNETAKVKLPIKAYTCLTTIVI